MTTKAQKDFKESVQKLLNEEKNINLTNSQGFSDPDQPTEYTQEQQQAINAFDSLLKQFLDGLITRKDFALHAHDLANVLPEWDWLKK